MSTTTPIAPNPYSRYSRPRSLFGPVLLIAIGVLFLLRTMGYISMRGFWPWFASLLAGTADHLGCGCTG